MMQVFDFLIQFRVFRAGVKPARQGADHQSIQTILIRLLFEYPR